MILSKGLLISLLLFLATACAVQETQYYWGSYEDLIYNMYHKPGKATPQVQVQYLIDDIEKARAKNKPVPPGLYAHLGVMYAALGNAELAHAAFLEEKKLFPEAVHFVDDMIKRAGWDKSLTHTQKESDTEKHRATGDGT